MWDNPRMLDLYKQSVLSQFEAALWMLRDCIEKCPHEHWSGPTSRIAKYEFWHVVHHTLSCADGYLSRDEHEFVPRPEFHPAGVSDIENEYPSRMFKKAEMLDYLMVCLRKLREAIPMETEQSLRGPSGFSWVKVSRAELHLYNIRHVMHHTGMLSAFLRRVWLMRKSWYELLAS
jgi:uncharacterized damage-inducible protein DinB